MRLRNSLIFGGPVPICDRHLFLVYSSTLPVSCLARRTELRQTSVVLWCSGGSDVDGDGYLCCFRMCCVGGLATQCFVDFCIPCAKVRLMVDAVSSDKIFPIFLDVLKEATVTARSIQNKVGETTALHNKGNIKNVLRNMFQTFSVQKTETADTLGIFFTIATWST